MSYIIILLNNVLIDYIYLKGNGLFNRWLNNNKEGQGRVDLKRRSVS